MLVLPAYDWRDPVSPRPPHRRKLLAELRMDRSVVWVIANWPETRWWLGSSSLDRRYRASNTATTTSKEKALGWKRDVLAGRVVSGG